MDECQLSTSNEAGQLVGGALGKRMNMRNEQCVGLA